MIKLIISNFAKTLPTHTAYAHCDIPCGIYDPHAAQVGAHTVIRMTQMILDAHAEDESPEAQKKLLHHITRLTLVKEEHAEIVKRELRILWGDYFKEEHLEKYPELNGLVFKSMKLASKARQEVNPEAAQELLTNVQQIAEIFFKTKNREVVKVPSVYPHGGEIVYPK